MMAAKALSRVMGSSQPLAGADVPEGQREKANGDDDGDEIEHGRWIPRWWWRGSQAAAAAGRVKEKVAPPPLPVLGLTAEIVPLWALTISLAMARPRPAPPWLPGTW
jgi:hypothetical protein